MKNQYFGDVNDYRKYGLLRQLGGQGVLPIGVCWMLTPNDSRPDGEKTEYLNQDNRSAWRSFDPELYDFLSRKVHGHESEPMSRDVRQFTEAHLPSGQFYLETLSDNALARREYFQSMWQQFQAKQVDVIFFDPDDGFANNNNPKNPQKPGHKGTAKKLFRDEVRHSLHQGFSVLLYQHFDRMNERGVLVPRLGRELSQMSNAGVAYSFWTPHVVFFLVIHRAHTHSVTQAVERVRTSDWTREGSSPTSHSNDRRHILVSEHR